MCIPPSLNSYKKKKTTLWYKPNILQQLPTQCSLLLDECVPIIKSSSLAVYDALWIYFKDDLSYKDRDEI